MRIAAVVNFVAMLGGVTFWYSSCRKSTPPPPTRRATPATTPTTATTATTPPTATTPTTATSSVTVAGQPPATEKPATQRPLPLTSIQAIEACLDRQGGVVAGACVAPATVAGVELGARPNDLYFAASKAMAAITWSSGKDAVNAILDICSNQQTAAAAKASSELACVVQYLQDRTTFDTEDAK